MQHQSVPDPHRTMEAQPLNTGVCLLCGAPRRTDGAALPGAAVLRLFAVPAANFWLLCDARSPCCLRPESGDAGLLPPRPQGYPEDPQDLWFACRRRAPYQSPVAPHALPGGKLLLHLRRGDRCAQVVLAYHPGAAALRAAGTTDPCRLYVRGLCVVPPDARLMVISTTTIP